MMDTKAAILYHFRDSLLDRMSVASGKKFEGLASAARFCKNSKTISNKQANKLINVDYAYNFTRYLNAITSAEFLGEVTDALAADRIASTSECAISSHELESDVPSNEATLENTDEYYGITTVDIGMQTDTDSASVCFGVQLCAPDDIGQDKLES